MAEQDNFSGAPQNPHEGPVEGQPVEMPGQGMKEVDRDARMWAMLAHLAGFGGIVGPAIGSVLGPLIIWLLKKDQYRFVDEQGKEALNFQITMLIYGVASGLLWIICIGIFLTAAIAIADIVLIIIAAIKANDGMHYRYPYPLIIRFVK